ncbi:MAG TPA: diaminopimelate epimerase [Bryobacteraceae bacterium]|nr:diaminopimelate epimerase [Bryobacteraceae bacterium]
MIKIPFSKLHGAENDFLLTWTEDAPARNLPDVARKICARYTGIGADGWMLVSKAPGGLATRLFNSDGSEPEISGNGTRCAAAFAFWKGAVRGDSVTIHTAAGAKTLKLLTRKDGLFRFEMNMGEPVYRQEEIRTDLSLGGKIFDGTILNVGNPQCAIFVDALPADWRVTAALAEADTRFPKRTNVSFVQVLDEHTLDVVFFERGAGETRSSGTGSTGAALAAILRGAAKSPVIIRTPAGEMTLRWEESVFLTGPAKFVGEGVFFLDD